ncbi:phage tail protein [Edwardsiella ictaluri]|uniref:Tail protein X n=1 Tax=Edwardsiella ictaluri TaxID=67780 RepID=A0ABY8GHZ3_EDWIC|nr:tail protein X [Edwardsiella ictaluri]AVZ82860.1 phage tail protein [Edwardsiella ictaluri]EKS7762472.1 tail protein X [Edwardsiella ictaluri]EKS7770422.1 tail protein X [Edwardsiella ictaluri]EKS7773564.1 tail protein X [Edwardsiella ictaluri]EKS7776087.1 tail protein X [Edwardsiella ictaluri]
MIVYSLQNETLDQLCWRVFGRTTGIVEQLYRDNPRLCELPLRLPHSTAVNVPEQAPIAVRQRINLWD